MNQKPNSTITPSESFCTMYFIRLKDKSDEGFIHVRKLQQLSHAGQES